MKILQQQQRQREEQEHQQKERLQTGLKEVSGQEVDEYAEEKEKSKEKEVPEELMLREVTQLFNTGIATIRNTKQKGAKDVLHGGHFKLGDHPIKLQASPEKIKMQQEDADRAMRQLLEEEEKEKAAAAAGSQKKKQAKEGKSEKKKKTENIAAVAVVAGLKDKDEELARTLQVQEDEELANCVSVSSVSAQRELADKDEEMTILQQQQRQREHQQKERLQTGLKEVSGQEIAEYGSMPGVGLETSRAVMSTFVIGRGGFAEVKRGTYRFPREQTPKDVAFKIFHGGLCLTKPTVDLIMRELALGMQLRHANVVHFFGVLTDPMHGPCLVLELCNGGSLCSVLNRAHDRSVTLSWKTRVKWLREIAVGVDFLHSWQPSIIHRDLKPANVLLSSKDLDTAVAKVADFGVSITLHKTNMSARTEKGGAGTLAWSAPETFKGVYSAKTDTYSFAMVMYETLTFLAPHAGKCAAEITRMVTEEFKVSKKMEERGVSAQDQEAEWLEEHPLKARRPDLDQVPRDCPEPLLSLMETCWSDSPDKRPSFRQIVDNLGKLQEPDYLTIFEAVKKNLVHKSPQSTRMLGKLNDLKSGNFADAANGFKKFLKVPEDWVPEKEGEVPKLVEEVRRLADCEECAKVHMKVLEDMVGAAREDLRGTLEITKRLADVLEELQRARRENRKEDEARLENQVQLIREEIDQINGWYYGRQNAPAVAWPEAEVKHDWGKYGQPMCAECKRYKLDHSTISADFNYVLCEKASQKEYPNGFRDKDREGKTIDDFWKMPQSKETNMEKSEAVSLRFYSSPSFPAVTIPLRDPDRETQHPLAAITYCIFSGIRKQVRFRADDPDAAVQEVIFWRGFTDLKISDDFLKHGGTEYAPMSTSTDPSVAVGYAVRNSQTDGALLMKIVTKNNLERGMDLSWISMFPNEAERLLPPLTFMNPPRKSQVIEVDGFKLSVVEIEVTSTAM